MKTDRDKKYSANARITFYALAALIIALVLTAIFSCSSSNKMVMPDGCKKKKEVKHEMVRPEPEVKRKAE